MATSNSRLRFSLRELLVTMTVIAICLSIVFLCIQSQYRAPVKNLLFTDQVFNQIENLTFSPDGTKLAVEHFHARDAGVPMKCYVADVSRTVAILDATTLRTHSVVQHQFLQGNQGPFLRIGPFVAFTPDSKYLEVSEWDRERIRPWDIASKKWADSDAESMGDCRWFVFSPDGSKVAVHRGESIEILDAQTRLPILSRAKWGWLGTFSPDGKTFAIANRGGVEVWNLGAKTLVWKFHENKDELDSVTCLALSPDGETVAVRCHEGLRL